MQTFVDPDLLNRLRVGSLASYLDAYLKSIEQEVLLPTSVPMQMYAIARFSNWLHTRQVDLYRVDEANVERFLQRDLNVVHSAESAPLTAFSGTAARDRGDGSQAAGTQQLPAAIYR